MYSSQEMSSQRSFTLTGFSTRFFASYRVSPSTICTEVSQSTWRRFLDFRMTH